MRLVQVDRLIRRGRSAVAVALMLGVSAATFDGQSRTMPADVAPVGRPPIPPKITGRNMPERADDVRKVAEKFKGTHDIAGAAEALVNAAGPQFSYSYGGDGRGLFNGAFQQMHSMNALFGQRLMICYEFVHYIGYLASNQRTTLSGVPRLSTSAARVYQEGNYWRGTDISQVPRGKIIVFIGWAFNNESGYYHVGVSLGNGKIAHNSSDGSVQISNIADIDSLGYREVRVADYDWRAAGDTNPGDPIQDSPDGAAPDEPDRAPTPPPTGSSPPSVPSPPAGGAPPPAPSSPTGGSAPSSPSSPSGSGGSASPSPPSSPIRDVPQLRQALDAAPPGLRVADNSSCCGDPLGQVLSVPAVATTPRYQMFVTGAPIDRQMAGTPAAQDDWDGAPLLTLARASASVLLPWLRGISLAATRQAVESEPTVALVATGASTGDAFVLRVLSDSGYRGRIMASDGLVLEATTVTVAMPRAGIGSDVSQLPGFCAEFVKDPPPPGTVYRVANAAQQARLKPMRQFFRAADQLAAAGKLHPDSNPANYLNFVKQYSMWTRLEGWNKDAFAEHFLARTKKNALAMKQSWTREVEAEVRKRIPGRWADLRAVIDTAQAMTR